MNSCVARRLLKRAISFAFSLELGPSGLGRRKERNGRKKRRNHDREACSTGSIEERSWSSFLTQEGSVSPPHVAVQIQIQGFQQENDAGRYVQVVGADTDAFILLVALSARRHGAGTLPRGHRDDLLFPDRSTQTRLTPPPVVSTAVAAICERFEAPAGGRYASRLSTRPP